MNKLEKLLYRKSSIEKLMSIWSMGIKMYSEYIDACKAVTKDETRSVLERAEAYKNIHEADIPLKHYITSYKLSQREYENHIVPEIEKTVTAEEKESIEFQDLTKKTEELADIEIFAEHGKRPENVELIDVLNDIRKHSDLLRTLIDSAHKKASETKDPYELAKLNLDVFKYNLHLMSNIKRIAERENYYNNQFKPKYDKDMQEADLFLEKLLERAREIVRLSIDIKLSFLLEEYEKNKHDREKVWLFYTALKSRLKRIGKEMRRNKGQFKGNMHLAEDIV